MSEKYKEWLQHSDGGDCFLPAGVQLYGIFHKPLIDVDYNDRPADSYVVIGALNLGTVPPDLMSSFNLIFYQSAEDAVFKALGVE